MNIEFRFLQKAIDDKNYICFSYQEKSYKNIKALKIDEQNRVKIYTFIVISFFLNNPQSLVQNLFCILNEFLVHLLFL